MVSEPLYKTIYEELHERIEHGHYNKGDLLPTEAKLCKIYNVSRVTIRQAIQLLVDEEYVKKIQGSGTHVIFSTVKNTLSRSSKIRSFTGEMHRIGKQSSAKILKFELIFASKHLAEELELSANDPVFYYERILLGDEMPYCYEYGYMPVNYFPDFSITNITGSKMEYVEEDKHFDIEYSHQIVHAILANEKLHNYLHVSLGSPLLEVTHLTYTNNSIPIYKTCVIFDSTKYQAHFIKMK